jgi:hypothetical protein
MQEQCKFKYPIEFPNLKKGKLDKKLDLGKKAKTI